MSPAPILVTGSQRSGNTWLGHMLAAAPGTREIYQPFNGSVMRRPEAVRWPFRRWKFTWVEVANEATYRRSVEQVLRPRIPVEYPLWELQRALRTRAPRVCWERFKVQSTDILRARLRGLRPVIGDPGGIFVAGWMHDRFGATVVALRRHPASIAAGYKRMGWAEDLSDLLEQPLLMEGPLAHDAEDLARFVAAQRSGRADWLDVAVWWWRIYNALLVYQRPGRKFVVVDFEELAEAPVDAIRGLYEHCGLSFTPSAEAVVREHTEAKSPTEALGSTLHVLARDTRSLAWAWLNRLDAAQIARVREQAEPHAARFGLELRWTRPA